MKTLLLISVAFAGLAFRMPETVISPQTNCAKASTWRAAVQISQAEFDNLTTAYAESHSGANLGGIIGKAELQKFIENIPNSQDFIRFRFCTDPVYQKTSLMMRGDHTLLRNTQYLRNSGVEGFCPTNCELQSNAGNVSLSISSTVYETLADAYASANPGGTYGGRIDKAAVLEIINSLPSSATNVAFRFCSDGESGKTSVIFVGGSAGQPGGANLFYRNGGNAEAYCPEMCN